MTGERMSTDNPSSVNLQTEASPIPSVPAWFGEVALLAHTMTRLGLLSEISEQVRIARKRFGTFEVIDFVVMLIGYAISGEATLKAYYERLQPFAPAFMALFARGQRSCKPIPSSGFSPLEESAMEITAASWYGDSA